MAPGETVFIVDQDGMACEIVGGRNTMPEDGYSYAISGDGGTVYQVRSDGEVDGEYDAHASREDIDHILSEPPVSPGPQRM
jgi:hypothetical protein